MGFWNSVRDTLFGGTSKDPSAFRQDYAHQGQIEGLINNGLSGLQGRQAPTIGLGPQDQIRNQQLSQAGQLQGIASGQQQGAGELAVQRQMQNALAGQQALARMRGAGGLGARAAARNSAAVGMSAAGMGQQAALQDQMQAHGALANLTGQMRGQDIGLANAQAQMQQNQQGMNDQQYMALMQQLTGMDANQLAAQMQGYQSAQQKQGILGGLLSAGGQVAGAYLGRPTGSG